MTKEDSSENDKLNVSNWEMSRISFVRSILLSGVVIQLPWLHSCSTENDYWENIEPLSQKQFTIIRSAQDILFPSDGDGPGALEIKADRYLIWVLNDDNLDANENQYMIDKTDLFIKECFAQYNEDFTNLSLSEQNDFINKISKNEWGKRWLSRLLTFIFEALLLHPIYGGNNEQSGWNWLEHDPGFPTASQKVLYPEIITW